MQLIDNCLPLDKKWYSIRLLANKQLCFAHHNALQLVGISCIGGFFLIGSSLRSFISQSLGMDDSTITGHAGESTSALIAQLASSHITNSGMSSLKSQQPFLTAMTFQVSASLRLLAPLKILKVSVAPKKPLSLMAPALPKMLRSPRMLESSSIPVHPRTLLLTMVCLMYCTGSV